MKNVDRHKMKKYKNHNHDITVIIYDSFILELRYLHCTINVEKQKKQRHGDWKNLKYFFQKK